MYQTRTDRVIPLVVLSPSMTADRYARRRQLGRARRRPLARRCSGHARASSSGASIVAAARRLIVERGDQFTTQELVKEAGVALQTFYRIFGGKDQLLLAVIGDAMSEACERWSAAAGELSDPLDRLRYYITSTLEGLDGEGRHAATARFIVSTRWQLHRQFPTELAETEKPFVDLLRGEVTRAVDAGLLNCPDPEWDPWFLAELARSSVSLLRLRHARRR